jgi:hypothetical protein
MRDDLAYKRPQLFLEYLKCLPVLVGRTSSGGITETTHVTSDKMQALTTTFNQEFVVNYYATLQSECTDTRKVMADRTQRSIAITAKCH